MGRKGTAGKKRRRKVLYILVCLAAAASICWFVFGNRQMKKIQAKKCVKEYMAHIEKKEYTAMYAMLAGDNADEISEETFVERNSNIYEGMETKNLKITGVKAENVMGNDITVSYHTSFDTVAGEVSFANTAVISQEEGEYKIQWNHDLIYPSLRSSDKIKVSVQEAKRGQITDRNGVMLAGEGTAVSVGIVPGKLEEKQTALQEIAALLKMDVETLENKLDATWVQEDSFVPIASLPKGNERERIKPEPDETMREERERQNQLLEIPGVMLSDVAVRSYPMGESAAHLTGYVQNVTAEDLKEHPNEGYTANSVIGRSGIESLYEKELKGRDGSEIAIMDAEGNKTETIASVEKVDGEDIRLTIDAALQNSLYEQFKEDPGCSVALHPYTGEVLALVSTPSYDNNLFILGMDQETWDSLNEDRKKPLYNRFRQIWCPGSSFKPVIAAIGLETEAFHSEEDFGNEGLSWQKDASWGDYEVTTLHNCDPVNLTNALIYSDNIYFAKAALKIGAGRLTSYLDVLQFNKRIPFEIAMSRSQYSNTEKIETEIQLADSGYGQGQILVNPLHLAGIYTAFLNGGNILKPHLLYEKEKNGEIWIPEAFSEKTVREVLEGLDGVINDPHGTAFDARREDVRLAGKTGTAELKTSKEDTEGTETGWFAVFTKDREAERPLLLVSMVENVKGTGGSGYVVEKDKAVLDEYLEGTEETLILK